MCLVFIDSFNLHNTFVRKQLLEFPFSSESIRDLGMQFGQSHTTSKSAYRGFTFSFYDGMNVYVAPTPKIHMLKL